MKPKSAASSSSCDLFKVELISNIGLHINCWNSQL
jgi:hypothetical protein